MKRHTQWHHRKPRSLGGISETRNMSEVPVKQHEAWHTLFYNLPAVTIAHLINEYYLDPDYEFMVVKK